MPQIYSVKSLEYFFEYISKATGRVATADGFVVKAVNNVRGRPQTFLTATTTFALGRHRKIHRYAYANRTLSGVVPGYAHGLCRVLIPNAIELHRHHSSHRLISRHLSNAEPSPTEYANTPSNL